MSASDPVPHYLKPVIGAFTLLKTQSMSDLPPFLQLESYINFQLQRGSAGREKNHKVILNLNLTADFCLLFFRMSLSDEPGELKKGLN